MKKNIVLVLMVLYAFSMVFAEGAPKKGGAAASSGKEYLVPKKKGPYVIGLSNSYSGNTWRAQMVAEFKYAADKLKAQGLVKDYIIADATGNTANQIQQIQNLIAKKVDAILIDANSDTALNPVIAAAHKANILVVAFDNTVTSPYAINVNTDQTKFAAVGAEWLVKKLNGKGNIIVLNGLAGTPVDALRWSSAKAVFDKHPGIKIAADVHASWEQATAQQAVSNLLSSFSNIDGIWSQGGSMTLGAIYAFQAAKRPLVPMTGEANNGLLKQWTKLSSEGFDAIAPSQPPALSVNALEAAVQALQGQDVGKEILLSPPVVTAETLKEYAQMDMPDSLWLPTQLPADVLKALFKQ